MRDKGSSIKNITVVCCTGLLISLILFVRLNAQEQKKDTTSENIITQEKAKESEKNWLELEREKINAEVLNVKCDYKDVEEIFGEYISFFGYSWDEIREKYKCEDIVNFVMPMEKKRWTFDVNIVTPSEGILTGNLILYGHYIKPPYKIEINHENAKMYINNIEYGSYSDRGPERGPFIPKRNINPLLEKVEKYEDKAESNDQNLKYAFVDYIKYKIDEWKKSYSKEEVLQKLTEYLDELKERERIRDYWIYDKAELLFDIKCWYYKQWNRFIPKRYFYTKEEIEKNPILGFTEEQGKQYEKEERIKGLEDFHKELNDLLGPNGNNAICLYSSTPVESYGPLDSFISPLFILLSDGTDYQKIITLDKRRPQPHARIAKELVFNCNKEDYLSLLNKIMRKHKRK